MHPLNVLLTVGAVLSLLYTLLQCAGAVWELLPDAAKAQILGQLAGALSRRADDLRVAAEWLQVQSERYRG